jgi:hypothetical protein
MEKAALAKPLLPDPGANFLLVMRHDNVELATVMSSAQVDDDECLTRMVRALRFAVKQAVQP